VLYLILLLLILIISGIPIVFSLGSSVFVFSFLNNIAIESIIQKMVYGVNSFIILAVPGFILAGKIMNVGGITKRIFKFAKCLVGHIPGGIAHANVLASILFAGMSGSAVADSGGLGAVEIEAMKEDGYDSNFSAAVTASTSIIGPIIPPSIPAVLFAASAGTSVGRLFIGGIIPGLLLALSMMMYIYYISIKRGYGKSKRANLKELFDSFKEAFWALLTPVILIGGIIVGIFTPTEASVVAVVYALIISFFVYKEINIKILYKTIMESIITTSIVGIIIAFSFGLSYLLTISQIPQRAAILLMGITNNPLIILSILILFFLIIGLFMDPTPAILILTPIVMPIIIKVGINPLHFGVIMILTLMIGLNTPPVGMCVYTVANLSKSKVEDVMKELVPFFIPTIIILFLIVVFPKIVTFLPNLLMSN